MSTKKLDAENITKKKAKKKRSKKLIKIAVVPTLAREHGFHCWNCDCSLCKRIRRENGN